MSEKICGIRHYKHRIIILQMSVMNLPLKCLNVVLTILAINVQNLRSSFGRKMLILKVRNKE